VILVEQQGAAHLADFENILPLRRSAPVNDSAAHDRIAQLSISVSEIAGNSFHRQTLRRIASAATIHESWPGGPASLPVPGYRPVNNHGTADDWREALGLR